MSYIITIKAVEDGKSDVVVNGVDGCQIKYDHVSVVSDVEALRKDTGFAREFGPGRIRQCIKLWQGEPGVGYDDIPRERVVGDDE